MKKSTLFIFIAYIWTKTLLGLTFNPFVSTRQVIRRPVLLPVIFTPLLGLIFLFLAGRFAAILITLYGFHREIIAVFLGGVLFSIIFWQLLLLYLLVSFIFALGKK